MDTLCAVRLDCCILRIFDDRRDDICDFLEVVFLESSACHGRSSKSQTACYERAFRIVRDGVLVRGDVDLIQTALQLLAGNAGAAQVDQHEVVVRAAGNQIEALILEGCRQCLCVVNDALLISLELRLERLAEADSLRRDNVLERTALGAREAPRYW